MVGKNEISRHLIVEAIWLLEDSELRQAFGLYNQIREWDAELDAKLLEFLAKLNEVSGA